MEKIYFHPKRNKINSIPVYTNYYQYQAITYFLRVAEFLEPQLTKDLDRLISLYNKTEELHEKYRENERCFIDNWGIFEEATSYQNAHLLELKQAIIYWAKRYNLVDKKISNKTYLEIALWAIPR